MVATPPTALHTEGGAPPFWREHRREDRQGLRHQHGGAESLNRAEGDQPPGPGRQAARGRGRGEQYYPDDEHDPLADEVAQPPGSDQHDGQHQRVRIDDPKNVV
jgi:hypothetical protein